MHSSSAGKSCALPQPSSPPRLLSSEPTTAGKQGPTVPGRPQFLVTAFSHPSTDQHAVPCGSLHSRTLLLRKHAAEGRCSRDCRTAPFRAHTQSSSKGFYQDTAQTVLSWTTEARSMEFQQTLVGLPQQSCITVWYTNSRRLSTLQVFHLKKQEKGIFQTPNSVCFKKKQVLLPLHAVRPQGPGKRTELIYHPRWNFNNLWQVHWVWRRGREDTPHTHPAVKTDQKSST